VVKSGIALLAYSPLAGGILSGKYLETVDYPTRGRMLKFPSYMKRYRASLAARTVVELHKSAMFHGHPNLSHLSLQWVYSRPFVCSTLIGATDLYQLKENICIVGRRMTDYQERDVNAIYWRRRDMLRIIQ